jgi:hypothetical protein
MRRRLLTLLVAIAPAAGCADLIVHKVPVDTRIASQDQHVDGFRYYLSRPYIAVSGQIEVGRTESLVGIGKDGAVTFLNGGGAGKTIALDELTATNPGTGTTRRVSPAELEAMKSLIRSRSDAADSQVRPAAVANSDGVVGFASDSIRGTAFAAQALAAPTPDPPTPAKDRHSSHLTGDIQIVYLPDMDEQYAIESKNVLSKTAFNLKFQDGWQLSDVYADHDSTPVALELLNTVDQAIDTAKSLALAEMKKEQAKNPGGGGGSMGYDFVPNQAQIYKLVQITYIKPGLYRLNKPWEAGQPQPTGCGFLAKLGLETFTTVELKPVTKPASKE